MSANWSEEEFAAAKQRLAGEVAQSLAGPAIPEPTHDDDCNSLKPIHEDGPCNCRLSVNLAPPLRAKSLTAHQKATGRIRQPRGMNKTEARYAQHLELQKKAGAIAWFKFEGITLKLAHDCRLTFDFAVMTNTGALELHDCKSQWKGHRSAHIEDDALAKMRIAADSFPFRVLVVWPGKAGEWEFKEF